VPEYVRHPGLAGDIGIDVQWHVIAGCTGEQSQRRTVKSRQREWGKRIADVDIGKGEMGHEFLSCGRR
jgi:hypothetical protein